MPLKNYFYEISLKNVIKSKLTMKLLKLQNNCTQFQSKEKGEKYCYIFKFYSSIFSELVVNSEKRPLCQKTILKVKKYGKYNFYSYTILSKFKLGQHCLRCSKKKKKNSKSSTSGIQLSLITEIINSLKRQNFFYKLSSFR